MVDSFEHIIALLGYNSSVGLAQIKVNTAKWILETVIDSTWNYYVNPKFHQWLPNYRTDSEILEILRNDSTNCLLASFYIRQIIQRWEKSGFNIGDKPDIVMTLYSYGLFDRESGKEIIPHKRPRSNFLGKIAASFYHSSKLREEFP